MSAPVVGSGRKASIEVRDLVVRYGKVLAVRAVSFTVATRNCWLSAETMN